MSTRQLLTVLENAIILLREENSKWYNNQKLANELGVPIELVEMIDKKLSER